MHAPLALSMAACSQKRARMIPSLKSRSRPWTHRIILLIHRWISLCKCQLDFLRATLSVDLDLDLLSDLPTQHGHGQLCSRAKLADGLPPVTPACSSIMCYFDTHNRGMRVGQYSYLAVVQDVEQILLTLHGTAVDACDDVAEHKLPVLVPAQARRIGFAMTSLPSLQCWAMCMFDTLIELHVFDCMQ